MDTGVRARRVVLVEGVSDASALRVLAARAGRDLAAEGVDVMPMGGATNIGHYLDRFGPHGLDIPLAGLCDAGEERDFSRALRRAGLGGELDRAGLEQLGFFVCVADLEDELIRAVGVEQVAEVVAAQGEGGRYRTFRKQPAQQGRTSTQQLRRFIACRSGAKDRYARALTEALDLSRVPRPLARLLAWI
jgi:hypothetical protein